MSDHTDRAVRHGWASVPRYVLQSLVTHATAAGHLDKLLDLLDTTDYLLHADLPRLHSVLAEVNDERAQRYARLISLNPTASNLDPAARATAFSITEALQGVPQRENHFAALARDHNALLAASWGLGQEPEAVVRVLTGHTAAVVAATALPDGRVVWVDANGGLRIVDPSTGGGRLLGMPDPGRRTVAGLPGGRVVTGGTNGVRLWDPDTGANYQVGRRRRRPVNAVAVQADGLVLTGGPDGAVRVWDVDTGAERRVGRHEFSVDAVAVMTDGRAVTGDRYGTVKVWDVTAGTSSVLSPSHDLPHGKPDDRIRAVFALRDGRVIVFGSTLWSWEPTKHAARKLFAAWGTTAIAVFPDGRIAMADGSGLKIWEPDGSDWQESLGNHIGGVDVLVALADGRVLSGGRDGMLRVWDPTMSEGLKDGSRIRSTDLVALLSDGRVMTGKPAAYLGGTSVDIWSPGERKPEAMGSSWRGIVSLNPLPDGRVLARHEYGPLGVFDPAAPRVGDNFDGDHFEGNPAIYVRITAVAVGEDGQVATGSVGLEPDDDLKIRLWRPSTGIVQEIGPIRREVGWFPGGITDITLLTDGRIAALSATEVGVGDAGTGTWRVLRKAQRGNDFVALAPLPDCEFVIADSWGMLQVWHPDRGAGRILSRSIQPVGFWARPLLATLRDGRVVTTSGRTLHVIDPSNSTSEAIDMPATISCIAVRDDQLVLVLGERLLVLDIPTTAIPGPAP